MEEPIAHPGLHRAVLACACGRVLNTGDMVRIRPAVTGGQGANPAIWRIGCSDCALAAGRGTTNRAVWAARAKGWEQ